MEWNDDSRLQRLDNSLTAEVGDELVMMNADTGAYYNMDAVGTDIWNRLAVPTRFGDLVSDLAESYDADPATIAADVRGFLTALAEKQLIKVDA